MALGGDHSRTGASSKRSSIYDGSIQSACCLPHPGWAHTRPCSPPLTHRSGKNWSRTSCPAMRGGGRWQIAHGGGDKNRRRQPGLLVPARELLSGRSCVSLCPFPGSFACVLFRIFPSDELPRPDTVGTGTLTIFV